MESDKFGITGCCGLSEPFRSLVERCIKLPEMPGQRLLQFIFLGRSELFLHNITAPYLRAGFLNRHPVRSRK